MNFTVNEITNSIAGKPSLSECSVDELRQLASQYPFFGPAQFLFVKKLKEEDSWQLKEQIRKASLYFQNPLWLDHLLNATTAAPVDAAIKEEEFIREPVTEPEPAAKMEAPVTHEKVVDHLLNTTPAAKKEEEYVPEAVTEPEPAAEMEAPVTNEEVVDHLLNDTAAAPVAVGIMEEEFAPEPITEPEPAAEMETPFTHEEVVDHSLNTTAAAPVAVAILKEEFIPEPAAEMETPFTHEEVVDQTRIENQTEFVQTERETEQYQPELLVEMPKFKFEPVDVSKTELTFEPYHTIDYFASQGIRPKAEEKPKDQFSRQLKSFTEWLKVMKRLPVTEIAAAVSAVDEKKVEKMAELSINDREVVTEAMAEVWEKQGNQAKARETYGKLSLLIPGKSSYFAAKIEQLKNL
jgi:hypothetical protein